MIRYGRTTQTAISAMSCLAEAYASDHLLSSRDISQAREIALPLVGKLLTLLSQAGLVHGARGPGGGYRLAKQPGEISLHDIATVFERPDDVVVCPFGPNWCGNNDPCPLHDAYVHFTDQFQTYLRNTHLDVFSQDASGAPNVDSMPGQTKRKGI